MKRRGRAGAAALAPAAAEKEALATTVRLDPETRRGLELLRQALGVTMNKLVNDGLALFVSTRTALLERDLEASLQRIKRYRRSDPTFAKDFEDIARAEVAHRHEDPVEGVAYRKESAGPAVSMVREVIASKR